MNGWPITDELAAAYRAVALDTCAHEGHRWDHILVEGSWDPVRLVCHRCGRMLRVVAVETP